MVLIEKEQGKYRKQDLEKLGIRTIRNRGRISYLRIFEAHDYYIEQGKTRLQRFSTFVSEKSIDSIVSEYNKYEDLLLKRTALSSANALDLARNFGQKYLIDKAEKQVKEDISALLKDKTRTSLELAYKSYKLSHLEDRKLTEEMNKVGELVSRREYLISLLNSQLGNTLSLKIQRALASDQDCVKTTPTSTMNCYKQAAIKSGSTRSAELALEHAIENNFSSTLLKCSYVDLIQAQERERKTQEGLAKLKALETCNPREYRSIVRNLGQVYSSDSQTVPSLSNKLSPKQSTTTLAQRLLEVNNGIETGYAQRNGDIVFEALARADSYGLTRSVYEGGIGLVPQLVAEDFIHQEQVRKASKTYSYLKRAATWLTSLF